MNILEVETKYFGCNTPAPVLFSQVASMVPQILKINHIHNILFTPLWEITECLVT